MSDRVGQCLHKLLDLVVGKEPIVLPIGGIRIWQHPVPGEVFSAASEYGRETFTVDLRGKTPKWSVTVQQKQPERVPPVEMSLSEWEAKT